MQFVDIDTARSANGLRMIVMAGVPSPWSQAAKAIVHIKGIEALGVWLREPREPLVEWTGRSNAPVALYNDEPVRTGWAEILALAERIEPEPRLIPEDPQRRVHMFGLAHELMSEHGLVWHARLAAIDMSLQSEGKIGFPLPVAQYLGHQYGYRPGCGTPARALTLQILAGLATELERAQDAGGTYYLGSELSAVDVYSTAVIDALAVLPEDQCRMDPTRARGFRALGDEITVPASLIAHRDMMHERHIPLPLEI